MRILMRTIKGKRVDPDQWEEYLIQAGDLYLVYCQWAEQNKEKFISQKELSLRLKEQGFSQDKRGGRYYWKGLSLKIEIPK